MDADLAGGTIPVFGNNDITNTFGVFLAGMVGFPLFTRGIIVILAVEKDDHVRILFDRTGITQVGELRLTVLPDFRGAAQLGNSYHRYLQVTCQRFQVAGNIADFLHPVIHDTVSVNQTQMVDDNQIYFLLV